MQGDDDFVKTVSAAQMTTAWHNGDSDKRPHPRHRTKAQRWREQQRAEVSTTCLWCQNRTKININSSIRLATSLEARPSFASTEDQSTDSIKIPCSLSPLPLKHLRHWSSPWFWHNLCWRILHGAPAFPSMSRRVYSTFICLWHPTLALPATSRRVCGALLYLGRVRRTALGLPTASPLTLGFLGRLFFDTLRSCFHKVLIAHHLPLPFPLRQH